jgi:hypothetical protein
MVLLFQGLQGNTCQALIADPAYCTALVLPAEPKKSMADPYLSGNREKSTLLAGN